jgi:glyoxylase-like metal-dependent hydrolase (beta-lactamase superfamily II)
VSERLYFRQLLSGRDFGVGDLVAHQFLNLVYLVGDRETGEAVVVDPAHDVDAILGHLDADGMHLTGVVATHHHADHIGGELVPGFAISGAVELLERTSVPVHVQGAEIALMGETSGLAPSDLRSHGDGDVVMVGPIPIELLLTPGHTPGSQCLLVDGRLLSGDTLFADGCGHTEMPHSDPRAFYDSLHRRLAVVPDDAVLCPGHLRIATAEMTMGRNRRSNFVFRPRDEQEWLAMFGPGGCDGARPVSMTYDLEGGSA